MYFLAATQDGWIMSDVQNGSLYAFQLQDNEWVRVDLGQYRTIVRVLRSPMIGEGVEAGIAVVQ